MFKKYITSLCLLALVAAPLSASQQKQCCRSEQAAKAIALGLVAGAAYGSYCLADRLVDKFVTGRTAKQKAAYEQRIRDLELLVSGLPRDVAGAQEQLDNLEENAATTNQLEGLVSHRYLTSTLPHYASLNDLAYKASSKDVESLTQRVSEAERRLQACTQQLAHQQSSVPSDAPAPASVQYATAAEVARLTDIVQQMRAPKLPKSSGPKADKSSTHNVSSTPTVSASQATPTTASASASDSSGIDHTPIASPHTTAQQFEALTSSSPSSKASAAKPSDDQASPAAPAATPVASSEPAAAASPVAESGVPAV